MGAPLYSKLTTALGSSIWQLVQPQILHSYGCAETQFSTSKNPIKMTRYFILMWIAFKMFFPLLFFRCEKCDGQLVRQRQFVDTAV